MRARRSQRALLTVCRRTLTIAGFFLFQFCSAYEMYYHSQSAIYFLGEVMVQDPVAKFQMNPYKKERYSECSWELHSFRETFPCWSQRTECLAMEARSNVVLVRGSTRCGKSTQFPQSVLEGHY